MAVEYTDAPLKVAPAAATSIAITPSSTAWANSAWAVISAATTEAWLLAGIMVDSAVSGEFEIDIGVGASGSEVVRATIAGNFDSTSVGGPNVFMIPVPIDGIASGARVAVRLRKVGTSTVAWRAKVMYFPAASYGATADQTSAVLKCTPTGATGVGVAPSGTSWANSSYGQLLASTPAGGITVVGMMVNAANANPHEIDISTGASGAETVKTTLRYAQESTAGGMNILYVHPPFYIGAGLRVATRFRKNGTNATSLTFKLLYFEGLVG